MCFCGRIHRLTHTVQRPFSLIYIHFEVSFPLHRNCIFANDWLYDATNTFFFLSLFSMFDFRLFYLLCSPPSLFLNEKEREKEKKF